MLLSSLHDELKLQKRPGNTQESSRLGSQSTAEGGGGGMNNTAVSNMEEDLDEDELRKIEHKNQDEVVCTHNTQSAVSQAPNSSQQMAMDFENQPDPGGYLILSTLLRNVRHVHIMFLCHVYVLMVTCAPIYSMQLSKSIFQTSIL